MLNKKVTSVLAVLLSLTLLTSCNDNQIAESSVDETVTETEVTPELPVTQTPELEGYNLLWSDEFDGDMEP